MSHNHQKYIPIFNIFEKWGKKIYNVEIWREASVASDTYVSYMVFCMYKFITFVIFTPPTYMLFLYKKPVYKVVCGSLQHFLDGQCEWNLLYRFYHRIFNFTKLHAIILIIYSSRPFNVFLYGKKCLKSFF